MFADISQQTLGMFGYASELLFLLISFRVKAKFHKKNIRLHQSLYNQPLIGERRKGCPLGCPVFQEQAP